MRLGLDVQSGEGVHGGSAPRVRPHWIQSYGSCTLYGRMHSGTHHLAVRTDYISYDQVISWHKKIRIVLNVYTVRNRFKVLNVYTVRIRIQRLDCSMHSGIHHLAVHTGCMYRAPGSTGCPGLFRAHSERRQVAGAGRCLIPRLAPRPMYPCAGFARPPLPTPAP